MNVKFNLKSLFTSSVTYKELSMKKILSFPTLFLKLHLPLDSSILCQTNKSFPLQKRHLLSSE